jgi:hypothetical protein
MTGKLLGFGGTFALVSCGLLGKRSEEVSRLRDLGLTLHLFGEGFGRFGNFLAREINEGRTFLLSLFRLGLHRLEGGGLRNEGLGFLCILEVRFGSVGFPLFLFQLDLE